MSNAEATINLVDQANIDLTKPTESTYGDPRFITKVPGASAPMIIKFLPNPRKTGEAYIPLNYYEFRVGAADKDVRTRPSLASLGLIEKDPEDTQKWRYISQLSELKKQGISKKDPRFNAIFEAKKIFEPKKQGWAYFIEPGKSQIKCLKLNTMLINILFGRPGNEFSAEIPSLLETLAKKGKSPYNITQENCWLKVYKTGEGMATKYFIEPCVTQVVDENGDEKTKWDALPVAPQLKQNVSLNDFPDPIEYEKKSAFTLGETAAFIESDGLVFPERFAPKRRNNNDQESSVNTSSVVTHSARASMDDIPF